MKKLLPILALALIAALPLRAQSPAEAWADSIYERMSETERLGQLFSIRAHSDKGPEHVAAVLKQIKDYKVGGLCFFQGTPEKQIELINQYQSASTLPLMISIDGEWGLGMRMKSTLSFPKQLTLGAIQDNRLIYDMGVEIARQMKLVGVHVNFAPVADVNNNPANPVINDRSFGEDRTNVAVKSWRYAQGMQDHGVMACAKHFPGHGDTDVDSHYDLPVIRHDLQRLDSIEFFPFRVLSEKGIGSMMIAHLNVPTLDERPNRPTTLSYNTVTRLLKEGMEYEGLIFTDALEMKGVTKHFASGQVEAEALLAGNDILLLPEDMEAAYREIRAYLADGRLEWADLAQRVKKVLRAKYELGISTFSPLPADSLLQQLSNDRALALKRELYANALTLLRNPEGLIPFERIDQLKMASLSIGTGRSTPFEQRLLEYKRMPTFQAGRQISESEQRSLLNQLSQADVVVVSLHDMNKSVGKDFGISESARRLLRALSQRTKVVLTVFGSPYSLKFFDDIPWVLQAYEDDRMAQEVAAEALFGARAIKGRLPVTASPGSEFGQGIITRQLGRFGFSPPPATGMSETAIAKIDELAERAIAAGATPGCAVLVAKNGQIIYKKAFGHHTYAKQQAVQPDDIYDLASLTKITSATLAVMRLYEQGRVHLDTPIVRYLPALAGSNKASLCLRDIMAHHAGLRDWIPFYKQTMEQQGKQAKHQQAYYREEAEAGFELEVAPQLYLRSDFTESIFQQIYDSPVKPGQGYKYSDLGFYLIAEMVKHLSGQPLDEYVEQHFYRPLGLQTASYRPLERFSGTEIVPTEIDNYFRLRAVRGYVHDMGAAMLGGVSGHAGLFASAQDVAIIMQMLLNGGEYGGQRVLRSSTVDAFTQRHPESTRRGIGFDMRQLDPKYWINLPATASRAAFGHTGFTGTCAWADPEEQLVFVFLSNRTYPSMNNYKLNKLRTRYRMLSAAYEAAQDVDYWAAEHSERKRSSPNQP